MNIKLLSEAQSAGRVPPILFESSWRDARFGKFPNTSAPGKVPLRPVRDKERTATSDPVHVTPNQLETSAVVFHDPASELAEPFSAT